MEAKELMIGDWVIYQCNPLRVQHIYNDGYDDIVAEITGENADEDGLYEEVYYVRLNDCSPIPLTAEILVDNGWHYDYELHHWWHKGVEFMIFENDANGFYCCFITSIDLSDIHKLQQLLRLCGREDLADNFKI